MYVLIVYDINTARVNKICKFLRQYLSWVQNSVFEGELTESQLELIKIKLKQMINEQEDSIIIYNLGKKWLDRQIIGTEKSSISNIL